jgi:hypothetical protein
MPLSLYLSIRGCFSPWFMFWSVFSNVSFNWGFLNNFVTLLVFFWYMWKWPISLSVVMNRCLHFVLWGWVFMASIYFLFIIMISSSSSDIVYVLSLVTTQLSLLYVPLSGSIRRALYVVDSKYSPNLIILMKWILSRAIFRCKKFITFMTSLQSEICYLECCCH